MGRECVSSTLSWCNPKHTRWLKQEGLSAFGAGADVDYGDVERFARGVEKSEIPEWREVLEGSHLPKDLGGKSVADHESGPAHYLAIVVFTWITALGLGDEQRPRMVSPAQALAVLRTLVAFLNSPEANALSEKFKVGSYVLLNSALAAIMLAVSGFDKEMDNFPAQRDLHMGLAYLEAARDWCCFARSDTRIFESATRMKILKQLVSSAEQERLESVVARESVCVTFLLAAAWRGDFSSAKPDTKIDDERVDHASCDEPEHDMEMEIRKDLLRKVVSFYQMLVPSDGSEARLVREATQLRDDYDRVEMATAGSVIDPEVDVPHVPGYGSRFANGLKTLSARLRSDEIASSGNERDGRIESSGSGQVHEKHETEPLASSWSLSGWSWRTKAEEESA